MRVCLLVGVGVLHVRASCSARIWHALVLHAAGGARFRPSVIVFEWMLLGVARYTATIELLEAAGYRTCWDGQNVAAVSRASGSDSVAP